MVLRALRRAVRELSHCVAELFACQLEHSEESCARYQSFLLQSYLLVLEGSEESCARAVARAQSFCCTIICYQGGPKGGCLVDCKIISIFENVDSQNIPSK